MSYIIFHVIIKYIKSNIAVLYIIQINAFMTSLNVYYLEINRIMLNNITLPLNIILLLTYIS